MNWTLTDTEGTPFEISNGEDRIHRVAGEDRGAMQQSTPLVVYSEDDAPTGLLDQSVRSEALTLDVSFPECASAEEAFLQARVIKAQCPTGGTLRGILNGTGVDFAQAVINQITHERIGVRNLFSFQLTAMRPSTFNYWADESGAIFTDESDEPFEV